MYCDVCVHARTSLEMDGTLNLPESLWGGLKKHYISPKTKYNLANLFENGAHPI